MTQEAQLRRHAHDLYLEGVKLRKKATEAMYLAEQEFFHDVPALKEQGRERALSERRRMLENSDNSVKYRTGGYKQMQDAKGDYAVYAAQSQMYSGMATSYFTESAALIAMADAIRDSTPR